MSLVIRDRENLFGDEQEFSNIKLEGIESANDIVKVYEISKKCCHTNIERLYIVNLENRSYKHEVNVPFIRTYKDSFAYINKEKELVIYSFGTSDIDKQNLPWNF